MITAQKTRGRRALTAAAISLAALSATGCGAINDQATTAVYDASDGVNFDAGDLKVRNLMLVTTSAESEARLLGTVVNTSDQGASLELNVNGAAVTVDVTPKATVRLENDALKQTVPAVGTAPGGISTVDVTSGGESVEQGVPVVDGTLPEYRPYLPEGFDEATVEHLEHAEEEHSDEHH